LSGNSTVDCFQTELTDVLHDRHYIQIFILTILDNNRT
jgi:hypothetical protein